MMEIDLSPSIAQVRDAVETLELLRGEGCAVTDELLSSRVEIPATQSTGVPHSDLLERLGELSDRHFIFDAGPLSFELTGTLGSPLDFLNDPAGDPSSVFEGPTLQVARRAWQGDSLAAAELPGSWRGDLSVHLRSPFYAQAPQVAWRVVRTVAVLVDTFAAYPWWRAAELIREGDRPVIVVVTNEDGVVFDTPSFHVVSLNLVQGASVPTGVAKRRQEVQSCSAARLPGGVALPEELMSSDESSADERLARELKPKAEACAWAWLSNAVVVDDLAARARLEFFGYRRKTFEVTAEGYVADLGRAYNAYRWATVEESPDRVLAVRQVVSLQDGDALPLRPDDVVTAAEPLYRALRAGEVAVVLETQRQARSIAIDTARQSAEAAQAAAKSAAERTIASLAAVAGIAVANATSVLSAEDARAIAIGIAALFLFLGLWAIFVEGPPMRSPIASLADDLPMIGYLLTEKERAAVLDMSVVQKAKRGVLRIRVVTPIVYALGAALSLGVAHARFGLNWP
jgi:hypothetical protein